MDFTAHHDFPPEYVETNNCWPLFNTCTAFIAIDTIFISLLYVSRYLGGLRKANNSMILLMTGCYFVCLCKIAIGLGRSSNNPTPLPH
jgi:hypothetical protein